MEGKVRCHTTRSIFEARTILGKSSGDGGRILTVLDAAATPQALDLPRHHLHSLKGEFKGFWAVTVRANWRIIFRFEGADAFDVELIDYH